MAYIIARHSNRTICELYQAWAIFFSFVSLVNGHFMSPSPPTHASPKVCTQYSYCSLAVHSSCAVVFVAIFVTVFLFFVKAIVIVTGIVIIYKL